jgi:hypothetical protein
MCLLNACRTQIQIFGSDMSVKPDPDPQKSVLIRLGHQFDQLIEQHVVQVLEEGQASAPPAPERGGGAGEPYTGARTCQGPVPRPSHHRGNQLFSFFFFTGCSLPVTFLLTLSLMKYPGVCYETT